MTLPLTLPASLMDTYRVDPTVGGWGLLTRHAVATPGGDPHALSAAGRSRWDAEGSTDPAEQNFGYEMITRHAPDGTPVATALFGQPGPDGTPSAIEQGGDANLAVLPDGTVALSSKPGSTHLISPDL